MINSAWVAQRPVPATQPVLDEKAALIIRCGWKGPPWWQACTARVAEKPCLLVFWWNWESSVFPRWLGWGCLGSQLIDYNIAPLTCSPA